MAVIFGGAKEALLSPVGDVDIPDIA